ncbi:DTX3L ligase, partial [Turnix velox]|nr:DTX3L ligase [Turnix velox]
RSGGGTMAAPLLVRLCPAPGAADKVQLKLQSYFQSGKRSGGGECEVRPGPEPGTYWVQFQQERDKRSVESRTDHVLEMGARRLRIVIQAGEGDLGRSPVAAQASSSSSFPSQRAARSRGDTAGEILTNKIFLTVSATLNTTMFTEEQRNNITLVCPNLKREGNPDIDGSEKLTGDFSDIEKAYHYFKDILADDGTNHNFSPSESKKVLEDEGILNTEEMDEFTVLTALYEYFNHACKKEIKVLCEHFGVHIISKDRSDGNTSVGFISYRGAASIQEARDLFIKTFQRSIKDLNQEKISITERHTLNETIVKLKAKFGNLLVKEEGSHLLLRGPAREISAARKFLAWQGENSQAEKNVKISSELYGYRNGVEVDASVFKLLEPILNKEIEDIKDKFDTVVEKKDSSYGQKVFIVFQPRFKTWDISSHATESFINAFQNAFAMLREKTISWKLSEDQNKLLNMLLNGKQLEDLHVKLKKKEDKFILSGLPEHLNAAEKHMVKLLNIEDLTQTKNRAPPSSDLGYLDATGTSERKDNGKLSSERQSVEKTEDSSKDECPICMETIKNKEILRKCKHAFCKECIDKAMAYKQICPVCNAVYGLMEGNQPEGTMSVTKLSSSLPGYPSCGTIEIVYNMHGGIQTSSHPNPGKPYPPTSRTAYLPDSQEGQEVLKLLRRAFQQKLIFTVGQSRTTGVQDVITWNDIHHKTSTTGGPNKFGYPDPDYLQRVRSELKARGIE